MKHDDQGSKQGTTITSRARSWAASALSCVALVGCVAAPTESETDTSASEAVGEATEELVTNCPYTAPAIDFGRELLITDLSVVNDPCRTSSTAAGCAAGTLGAWTFGKLMSSMAGATPPAQLVADWLHSWEVNTAVNGFNVPARLGIRPALINKWQAVSGCPVGSPIVGPGACALDLTKAPFRLLSIVNRVDAGGVVGSGSPGEGRFVFGAFDLNNGAPLPMTVIFEYSLPTAVSTFSWAQQFHALGATPFGPSYNAKLQAITNQFAAAGAQPGKPNGGSAIGQVRTNEIAFGPVWEWREQRLTLVPGGNSGNELLRPVTVKETPANSVNNSPALNGWLAANVPAILAETSSVPATFNGAPLLGGASQAPPGFLWQGPLPPPDARHLFGLATCNGCHTSETATAFTHIGSRPQNQRAPLSPFMAVSAAPNAAGNLPAAVFTFKDATGVNRQYNEPWRRVCEMRRLLAGDPTPWSKRSGAH
jgi:hypothetical protein